MPKLVRKRDIFCSFSAAMQEEKFSLFLEGAVWTAPSQHLGVQTPHHQPQTKRAPIFPWFFFVLGGSCPLQAPPRGGWFWALAWPTQAISRLRRLGGGSIIGDKSDPLPAHPIPPSGGCNP